MKYILIICFSFLTGINSFAQSFQIDPYSFTDVEIEFTVTNIKDSLQQIIIQNSDGQVQKSFELETIDGDVNGKYTFVESGNYEFYGNDNQLLGEIRIIPGWTSILPPLVAILLALLFKQVVIALASGIYVGAFIVFDYDPLAALLRLSDHYMVNSAANADHVFVILFTLLIGGVVGVISKNGGTAGLALQITRYAKSAKSGMVSSWFMGVIIFFDDYANTLIIGNMMRPITDKLRISREKLAYIVDSTAAPVASVVFISTWIGYEVGLINDALQLVGEAANGYDVFLNSIPYSFYSIAAIFFVFMISYSQRDFGAMYKAEQRARKTGKLFDDNSKIENIKENSDDVYTGSDAKWYNGAIPIAVILFGTIIGLFATGINSITEDGLDDYSIRAIIGAADSYASILWASFFASITAILMSVWQKRLTLSTAIAAWQKGIQTMLTAVIILVFAWAISDVTAELKTADYIISILSDSVNPSFLPFFVFIICALIGFSTGTSWGTMAIVMPIVIPLTYKVFALVGVPVEENMHIIYGVVSAVLTGSVFGDHCSPIADTTILSSLASKCDHIDHVRTQLPYSLVVGGVTLVFGYLLGGFGFNPFLLLAIILILLAGTIFIFGKKTETVES